MLNQHWVDILFDTFVRLMAAARFTRGSSPVIGLCAFVVACGAAVHYAPSLDDGALARPEEEAVFADAGEPASPVALPPVLASHASVRTVPSLSNEQHHIARFIARRYRIAIEQTQEFVEFAYRTAREAKLDPWLILAIISVESSFDPTAQSSRGAQGLMQVLTRVHADKFAPFGGVAAAFDPLANMRVGAQILKSYLARDGSVEGALKAYVGAAMLPHDGGYGAKVLTERERIAAAASGRPELMKAALSDDPPARPRAPSQAAAPEAAADALRPPDPAPRPTVRAVDAVFTPPADAEILHRDDRARMDLQAPDAAAREI